MGTSVRFIGARGATRRARSLAALRPGKGMPARWPISVFFATGRGQLPHPLDPENAQTNSEGHIPSTHTYGAARKARALLDELQIDINSALNGAALKNNMHHGMGLHSHDGMKKVLKRLQEASENGGRKWSNRRAEVIRELRAMASEMEAGVFRVR